MLGTPWQVRHWRLPTCGCRGKVRVSQGKDDMVMDLTFRFNRPFMKRAGKTRLRMCLIGESLLPTDSTRFQTRRFSQHGFIVATYKYLARAERFFSFC
jgi:hypothetical protein